MLHESVRANGLVRVLALTLLPAGGILACSGGAATGGGATTPNAGMSSGGSAMPGGATSDSGAPGAGAPSGGTAQNDGGTGQNSAGNTSMAGMAGMPGGGAPNGGVAPVIAAGVRWFGRVDVSNPQAIKLAWSGTGFIGTFTGPTVSVKLATEGGGDIYFQPVVDGTKGARFPVSGAAKAYEIAKNLGAGEHQVELYRESEGKGLPYSVFSGFAAGTPGTPPAFSGRLLEVIGDSITAGYGNLGMEDHSNGNDPNGGCRFSTETESAYMSYSHTAARAVNADASVLAGSGWGVYSDLGGNTDNVMSKLFGNTVGEQSAPAWGFSAKPQAVVINLGTNDNSAGNLTADKYKPALAAFVETIRGKYPDALILCAVGSMLGDTEHKKAVGFINEIVTERAGKGDKSVKLLDLGIQNVAQGTGCDWHPNVADDARMASILSAELKKSLGW